jgi:hypothetical protein
MSKPDLLSDYDTPDELAASLGICTKTLDRWRLDKKGPPITYVGRKPYYHRDSAKTWLRSQEKSHAA